MMLKYPSDKLLHISILLIYLFVNGLFVFKYSPLYPALMAGFYVVMILLAYVLYNKYIADKYKTTILNYLLLALIFSFVVVLLIKTDAMDTTVDRWSALKNWTDALFRGEFPYGATTHKVGVGNHPSPFPVWEILHIPIALTGEMGIAHLIMLVTLFCLLSYYKANFRLTLFLALLIASPCYWWEIIVRSDLMNNLFLGLIFITIFHYRFRDTKNVFLVGVIIGLLLCTRLFLAFPLAIYFIPYFWKKTKSEKILLVIASFLGLVVPLVPFYIWDWNMMVHSNHDPLTLQANPGNPIAMLVAIFFIIAYAFIWKNFYQYFAYIAIAFFGVVLLSFLGYLLQDSFMDIIENDLFDISYFAVSLPFVLFGLSYHNAPDK